MRNSIGIRRTRINAKRLTLVIIIAIAVVALCLYLAYMNKQITLDSTMEQELLATGTFQEGVSVGGVDVSGLTMEQGKIAVSPVVNQMLNSNRIEFTVHGEDQPYIYSLEEMGVSVDPTPALREAMLYGREGTNWSLKHEELPPKNFQLQKTFNIGEVEAKVNTAEEQDVWGEPVVNANYKVEASKDEDSLTTSAKLIPTEPHDGYAIDKDSVIATIENQIMQETYEPFEAPMEVLVSKKLDTSGNELSLMGTMTTDFSSSKADRKYNIWKMSSILNGQTIDPGETFSVNDTAGDRNEENGWKEADGIENGRYTPQYGGGICQVSTTLYNACLKAEMNIEKRVPHTIAAKYVAKGLDATISTGGPDFAFSNPYDTPVYVVIKCDGGDGVVTAELWGYDDRDYRVSVYSEEDVSERGDIPAPVYVRNNELPNSAIERVTGGQQQEVWNVYKDLIDKETGDTIQEKVFVTKSTYNAIQPVYEVGPGRDLPADGTPIGSVSGGGSVSSRDDDIQATPEPASKPTSSKEPSGSGGGSHTEAPPTQKPSSDPTKPPEPPTQEPSPEDPPASSGDGGDGGGGENEEG